MSKETTRKQSMRIALVAHDNRKSGLIEWVRWNRSLLVVHHLVCTGTTGRMVLDALKAEVPEDETAESQPLPTITLLKSGPLGGDQQLGALIADSQIDLVIFFWDPLAPHPHDVDVKALLRIAVVYNVPIACNRATADFVISSPLMHEDYSPERPDHSSYTEREVPAA